ncbi:Glycogen debranching enzyme [Saliniradius amylolyticus]|uniref:Glycogen debranching enzyme n=1 Tax=Saliniradius amylolyticus TaxID=2183582 RepID=A0A2S2E4I7_9ALTE|nr:glycogen debranching protein GlgX [Saliniradius amylolyticus]AWL12160.1 Glycogen debranching enzyme [Saliniradius amylolyticus]
MTKSELAVTGGRPGPLGAQLTQDGCNFAVHAPLADGVRLCLYHPDTEELLQVLDLPQKSGKVWHGHVAGVGPGMLYGYRTLGRFEADKGLLFDAEKLLIDPYAVRLNRPINWDRRQYQQDSAFMIPKAVVTEPVADYDASAKPLQGDDQRIIYEAHVKGLSQQHPEVPETLRGTYLGACHPAVLKHLTSLGVTAIQFLPIAAFMPEPYITDKGLTNYWGYNTVNFFAPDARYAQRDPLAECRKMVQTFHDHGIEVILDVVFNHTAEGGTEGPVLSLKGFDNRGCYLFERDEMGDWDYRRYRNNSGCGNSVNMATPFMLRLVMDALRFWVQKIGVDGFRFDLAASLGRDPEEFTPQAGFFRALRQDPVLSEAVLIAEPWDIGVGGYRLGQFPSHWHEVNDKYRDTVRAFWRGDKGLTAEFATRLLGSRDVFHKGHRSIHSSVNNITYHDGFTLQDLVSYTERHNQANGEQNRDGHGHNLSANYGHEGETRDVEILELRERQKRNLFATLIFSQGTPHILGGDELSRTQKGNNNAYCQDNDISWFDWQLNQRKQDFLSFCQRVIQLRRRSRLLSHLNLHDDPYSNQYNVAKIGWYRPDGARKVVDDWHDVNNQAFAVALRGEASYNEHWLLLINASEHDVDFQLPDTDGGWNLMLDTRYAQPAHMPDQITQETFNLSYRSLCLFKG